MAALGVQFGIGHFQGLDNEGKVIPYGSLYFTDSFTGEPILTYKNSSLTVVNTHPVILSASGKADIFLSANQYNIAMHDANDQVIWSIEDFTTVGLGVDLSSWREKQVAAAAQTDFVFGSPIEEGASIIFVNGSLKEEGATEDYIVIPPYTVRLNVGASLDDEVVAFGATPTISVSSLYADGSVPMNDGYVPAIPLDLATKESSEAYTDQEIAILAAAEAIDAAAARAEAIAYTDSAITDKVDMATWTFVEVEGVLYFKADGVKKAKLDGSGNLTVVGDVTAFGTI